MKIYAPGIPISAADGARGLSEINQMLDEWSNETLMCIANVEQSFQLMIGKNSYSIGLYNNADINLPRPLLIFSGPGAARLTDTNNNRYEVDVVEQDVFNQIGLLTETSDIINTLFYDPQYPLGIINIFPTPSATYTVTFDSRLKLTKMPSLDVAFILPEGFASAIKNNLLIRLWSYYKQGDPTPQNKEDASRSLASIKRTNIKYSASPYDSAIVSKAQAGYNIFNDTQGRGS
jgi:hypothetical protein